jgi:hypothetical protein
MLSHIISEYDHNDAYNIVETAMFYRMQTDRTSKKYYKKAEAIITFAFCSDKQT